MNWINTNQRYGTLSITMHWLMVLLIIAVFASIELRELFEKGTENRDMFKSLHFMFGLTVFALVWIRLIMMLQQVTPAIMPTSTEIQMKVAKAVHVFLYLIMIGMPISGWLILSAAGKPIPFYGYELPALIDKNKEIAELIEEVHETVGEAGYFIIGLHAAAALYHHYIMGDNTLSRMLPEKD